MSVHTGKCTAQSLVCQSLKFPAKMGGSPVAVPPCLPVAWDLDEKLSEVLGHQPIHDPWVSVRLFAVT